MFFNFQRLQQFGFVPVGILAFNNIYNFARDQYYNYRPCQRAIINNAPPDHKSTFHENIQTIRDNTFEIDATQARNLYLDADILVKDKFTNAKPGVDVQAVMNQWMDQTDNPDKKVLLKLIFLARLKSRLSQGNAFVEQEVQDLLRNDESAVLKYAEHAFKILVDNFNFMYSTDDPLIGELLKKFSKIPQVRKEFMSYLLLSRTIEKYVPNVYDFRNVEGQTLLHHIVINYWRSFGSATSVDALLYRYPRLLELQDYEGKTALFYASNYAVQDLFEHGAKINTLDNYGNSPMHYEYLYSATHQVYNPNYLGPDDQDSEYYQYVGPFESKMLDLGGKCIRRGKEYKSRLQLQIGHGQDLKFPEKAENTKRKNQAYMAEHYDFSPEYINFQDEVGRTALDYAIIDSKYKLAFKLLDENADPKLRDHYGRNALHYALISKNMDLVQAILQRQKNAELKNILAPDNQQVSCLALACYSKNMELFHLIKNADPQITSEMDQLISAYVADLNQVMTLDRIVNLQPNQQLIAIAAVHAMRTATMPDNQGFKQQLQEFIGWSLNPLLCYLQGINQLVKDQFLPSLCNQNYRELKLGKAYGIEIESSNIDPISMIPIEQALKWFDVNAVIDTSVHPSMLMKILSANESELTSQILNSQQKIQQFMFFVKMLYDSGARVNKSCGLHVHVNINGRLLSHLPSIAASITTDALAIEDTEVMIIKQILTNYAAIEPILQAFMRNGNRDNRSSQANLSHDLAKIKASRNYYELLKAHKERRSSINLCALGLHGTIEFRFHEGCVDPILVQAWLNLIDRLIDISIDQVRTQLNLGTDNQPEAFKGIEELVYILIAERDYAHTWNNEWGAVLSANVENADTNIQEQIQQATLYKLYLLAKRNQDFSDVYQNECAAKKLDKQEAAHILSDLKRMLELISRYPGLDCEPIDMREFAANLEKCQIPVRSNKRHKM